METITLINEITNTIILYRHYSFHMIQYAYHQQYGNKSARLVEGSYENLKITTPEDLIMAQAILDNRAQEF